jgi:glycosyltransferase involved in cell wall biosynthesis
MRSPRLAIISDTVDHTDGVAIGLRRLVAASTRAGHSMTLLGPENPDVVDDVVRMPARLSAALPFYAEYTWSVPELAPIASYLAKSADILQIATPGPMGIAGLLVARMIGMPVIAQYHTEVAEYAARMTGMPIRGVVEPLVGWIYRRAELCLAPSTAVEQRLLSLGVARDRIQRIPRGVDLELFSPAKRDRAALSKYGIGDGPVALYVGRVSKEKNMAGLLAAWARVRATRPTAQLMIVGDGPIRAACNAPGVVCTGSLYDEDLAHVFASADVFAFASETETFGNVVVEAAASGLPAVVMAGGAVHEHVHDGETGFVCRDLEDFAAALGTLLDDPQLRAHQGLASRTRCAAYDLDHAMRASWAIYDTLHARRAATWLVRRAARRHRAMRSIYGRLYKRRARHVRAIWSAQSLLEAA